MGIHKAYGEMLNLISSQGNALNQHIHPNVKNYRVGQYQVLNAGNSV